MKKTKLYLSILLATALVGCGSDDSSVESRVIDDIPVVDDTPIVDEPPIATDITMAFINNDSSSTEYVVSSNDLMTGSISVSGSGIEQSGWNFFYPVGNTLFVSGYTEFKTTSYKVDADNEVSELNTFLFDNSFNTFGNVNDTTLLATNSYWYEHDDMVIYTADAETGRATNKQYYSIYNDDTGTPGEGTVPWPTALKVQGDYLFIPYLKFDDSGYATTPDNNTAYVAVFDYPLTENMDGEILPNKIISDDRTGNIGVHGSTTGLIATDNGDLYGFSAGSVASGNYPASSNPSGILRIANGETEFDSEYFFNIEEETGGKEIFWMDSLGGNKALARIFTPTAELEAAPWSAYSSPVLELVILDLEEKTITTIPDLPLHTKQVTSSIEVVDGKVYVMIDAVVDDASEKNIYQIDIETGLATKGASVEGTRIKGFYDLYN